MMTAQRELTPNTAAADGRSPFVRLTELIAGIEPGKPMINLSVGEPQHPIPTFVGPVLAAHLDEFGRYPANKGSEPFRRAVAQWLGRRYRLARPVDPESEVLVLNGTREGLFLGAIAAKRWVPRRTGKPAILIPNPFYAAYGAGASAADCEPVYMPTTRATGFLPDLDTLDEALLSRTVAFYIASPSNPQGAVASRAYLDKLAGLARRFGFLVLPTNAIARSTARTRRPACSKPPGLISPIPSCFIHCRSARRCRACASVLPPATGASLPPSSNFAMSLRRKCRGPRNM